MRGAVKSEPAWKKKEGRLPSPFPEKPQPTRPQPKQKVLLLAFLLGFLLGLAFGFRLPLSCHCGFPSFASEASLASSGLTNQRSTSVAAKCRFIVNADFCTT
jgi:hypothetical protein